VYTPDVIVPTDIVLAVVPSVVSTPLPETENVLPSLVTLVAAASTVSWTLEDNLWVRAPAFAADAVINNIMKGKNRFIDKTEKGMCAI